jgi:hypothetical protein
VSKLRAAYDWYLIWHTDHLFKCRVRVCLGFSAVAVIGTVAGVVWVSGQL